MDNLLFTTEPFLTGKPLEVWLDSIGIRNWSINADGLVDVRGNVWLDEALGELKRLPVRFGQVGGGFCCDQNQLVSLEGAPKRVNGDFWCSHNQLVSLEGVPKQVSGDFFCDNNQLVSLKGAPKQVSGDFRCSNNQLVSLEGVPNKVGRSFQCSNNQLFSLEGAPNKVGRDFVCDHNLLVTFKGMERVSIGENLIVTSLGSTTKQDNIFISMEGLPKKLHGKVKGLDIKALMAMEEVYHSGIPDIEI